MIFRIFKTSWRVIPKEKPFEKYFEKPCEKAYIKDNGNGKIEWYIEINTLEDLIKLQKEVNEEFIFNVESPQPFIEIYDFWRE